MKQKSFETFSNAVQTYDTVTYTARYFADGLTPIHIVQKLHDQVAFLLESKDEQSTWSRYSFIGLDPLYSLKETGGRYLTTDRQGKQIVDEASFNQALEETMNILHVEPVDLPIPFRGGAVGYMSYDAIETIEPKLKRELENQVPHYHFIFCETLIAYDHLQKELIIIVHLPVVDRLDANQLYQQGKDKVSKILTELEQSSSSFLSAGVPASHEEVSFEDVSSNYTKQAFIKDVETIQEYIKAGDVFQTVLSQQFTMPVTVGALDIYRVLRLINPSPYLFYLRYDGLEIVGSSPERLVQVQDDHVEIHPIAGTRRRGKTPEEDLALSSELLADEKERAEHYMLVDLARNDVGRIAKYGSVKTPQLLEIGLFSHVMHIVSKVTGELHPKTKPLEALMASFPAGTVSGAPKIRAMEILQELEPTRRGIYAGAIGYLGYDGNIDSCIAIRTMTIQDGIATIQAGAGVVADSNPESEYEETQNKAKALIRAVQVAEGMFQAEGAPLNV
ncbi:anthranilate synthase component I [Alkalicoccobacillus plakortidis]|uniref:Anthranilate synthase component 1 n=1 Tax=Alkalicoccobacillus plakortidis TaxID=444060 RepID=A0ABT0XGI5_9BACI|nr:anthranilate synthase component I [Alkalicoccobacillus plakortidis]MCM2674339.1 anthranilate synthase component I [Alkalicoccobacillus plakortidis]